MTMRIKWTPLARRHLRNTLHVVLIHAGSRSHSQLANKVIEWQQILKEMPEAVSLEPLLRHRALPYRSIVINKLNKLIYYIDNETIIIADFWDTRREPNKQADQI